MISSSGVPVTRQKFAYSQGLRIVNLHLDALLGLGGTGNFAL